VARANALAKIEGEIPLRRMTTSSGAFDTLRKALGVSGSSARTLMAAAWIFGDPRAQAVIDEVAAARLRGEGQGMVLAPTPFR